MAVGKLPDRLRSWLDGLRQFSLGSPLGAEAGAVLLGTRLNALGRLFEVRTITATSSAYQRQLRTDDAGLILVDASAGAVIIQLPSIIPVKGTIDGEPFVIKKVDATANLVTIETPDAALIDTLATIATATPQQAWTFVSHDGAWYIV